MALLRLRIWFTYVILLAKGEFWLVCNGTKRGFDSYDTFLKLGFYNELGVSLYNNEVEQIPTGPTITAAEVSQAAVIAKNYQPVVSEASKFGDVKMAAPLSEDVLRERLQRRKHYRNALLGGNSSANASSGGGGRTAKCEVNETLEALVVSPGTRCVLYLVAHDNESEHLARKFSACKENWIHPVRVNSTVFFESVIYSDIFPAYQKEWENLDYVATGTYKTVAKQLHYNKFNQGLDVIQSSLQVAHDGDYDIVPFLRSGSGTMSFCLYFHGKPFKAAWDALLLELGYSLAVIRSLDEMKSFYRNIFIIKPKVLKELMLFMARAMHVATHNSAVRALLEVDARYKEGSEEVAMRIFGTKYYQLHPFIFERLPSFFLHASNAKICAATAGPCPYNS
jgi:hypothetical protein